MPDSLQQKAQNLVGSISRKELMEFISNLPNKPVDSNLKKEILKAATTNPNTDEKVLEKIIEIGVIVNNEATIAQLGKKLQTFEGIPFESPPVRTAKPSEQMQKIEAAKKIQAFFRNVKEYQKLKSACLKCGSILELRKREIASIEEQSTKPQTTRFIRHAYGAKMATKFTEEKSVDPIEMFRDPTNMPVYMREAYEDALSKLDNAYENKKLLPIARSALSALTIRLQICENAIKEWQENARNAKEAVSSFFDSKESYEYNDFLQLNEILSKCGVKLKEEEDEEYSLLMSFADMNYNFTNLIKEEQPNKEELKKLFISFIYQFTKSRLSNFNKESIIEAIKKINEIPPESLKVVLLDEPAEDIRPFLKMSGATPSYYAILETLTEQNVFPKITKELPIKFSDGITLQQLMGTTNNIKQELLFHGPQNVILNMALKFVEGLKIFNNQEEVIQDKLNQQFFYVINKVLNLMYTYRDNSTILNNLYDILTEEVAAILMYNGNPGMEEYTNILNNMYRERIPVVAEHMVTNDDQTVAPWVCDSFLASSGMGAIFATLHSFNKEQEIYFTKGIYFETERLSKELGIKKSETPSKVIFSILNSSSPPEGPNITEITKMVEEQIHQLTDPNEYVTLIIDNTIELGTPEENKLQMLLSKLQQHINNGKLNVILPKSLQKHAMLGTSKIMAGSISMINNGDPKFNQTKKLLQEHSNSLHLTTSKEYQFLSYLLQLALNL